MVNASPEVVFEAIRQTRNNDFYRRKLQSYDGKVAIVKEELEGVPVHGKVSCVWQETEEPYKRIDFQMVSSDKFKASHGAWILTPSSAGKKTNLELQAHVDPGIMLPFAGEITKSTTSKDSKARLEYIKKTAEALVKA